MSDELLRRLEREAQAGDPAAEARVLVERLRRGELARARLEHEIELWNASTGARVRSFVSHQSMPFSLAFSPDARQLLSGERGGALGVYDLQIGGGCLPDGRYNLPNGQLNLPNGKTFYRLVE